MSTIEDAIINFNRKYNPVRFIDAVTKKCKGGLLKDFSKKNEENEEKLEVSKVRLGELRKFMYTWKNTNVVTTQAERERVLNEIADLEKLIHKLERD